MRKSAFSFILIAFFSVLSLSGCGTLWTKQVITVTSDPPGAEIRVRNQMESFSSIGAAPASTTLKLYGPDYKFWVEASYPGYYKKIKALSLKDGDIDISSIHIALQPYPTNSMQQQQQQQQQVIINGLGGTVQHEQYSDVTVVSDPEYGEIYIDGQFAGNCPANLHLKAGRHSVVVKKDGYKDYHREMTLVEDSKLTVRATLSK